MVQLFDGSLEGEMNAPRQGWPQGPKLGLAGSSSTWILQGQSQATGSMDEQETLRAKLQELTAQHRKLDQEITELSAKGPADELEVRRMKKRKLMLKDMITRLESQLLPDIIA